MHVISRKVVSIREKERKKERKKKRERKRKKKGKKYRPVFACCSPDGRKRQTARGEKPENQILILGYARVEDHAMPGRLY